MGGAGGWLSDVKWWAGWLGLDDLRRLDDWLHAQIAERERLAVRPGQEPVRERPAGAGVYRLVRVRCGKPGCKCAKAGGEGHGPYWYHYRWQDGKTRCTYIGKTLPDQGPGRPALPT